MFSLRTGGFGDVAFILVAGDSVWVLVVEWGVVEVTGGFVWTAASVVGAKMAVFWFVVIFDDVAVSVGDDDESAMMGVGREVVWVETDVVVVAGGSVWVLTSSRVVVGLKQCCPWPAIFHLSCYSYSPFTIPFP
jgi:hypothetical protein